MKTFQIKIIVVLLMAFTVQSFQAGAQKRYHVRVSLKNGKTLHGILIRSTEDSLKIKNGQGFVIAAATTDIKWIKVRRKGAIGRGIGWGAFVGGIVGGLIGFVTYTPPDCTGSFICIDFGPEFNLLAGALLGGLAGSVGGGFIGSNSTEIKIEGSVSQMDLFNNEFLTQDSVKRK